MENEIEKIQRPKIKVFFTKTRRFRAIIDDPIDGRYQVTIGGVVWSKGLGNEYKEEILRKSHRLLVNMKEEFEKISGEKVPRV